MKKQHWQDTVNALLGVWIFISPWLLQYVMGSAAAANGAGGAATWNLYIVGIAIAVFAIAALFVFNPWEEWVNVALGAWLLVSPWLLGFSTSTALMWNAVIAGGLVVVFAGWVLTAEQGSTEALK